MFRMLKRTKITGNAMGKKGWKMVPLRLKMIITLALISVLMFGFAKMPLAKDKSAEAPKMTKEQLQTMLGKPDVIILDVRVDREWKESKSKIQGAIREDPWKGIESWAEKYPKDKTLVLYCS
jgi:predicted sulfurtransferase